MKNVKKGFLLSAEEINVLENLKRKLQGTKHYDLRNRIRGVLLVGGESRMKNQDAADACKVHVRTLRAWLARYRESGIKGLKRRDVSGRPSKLTLSQKEELKRIIRDGPEKSGYDTGRWTASMVCELVLKRFDVRYSLSNIQRLLARLGFSFKLPEKKLQEAMKQPARSGWM